MYAPSTSTEKSANQSEHKRSDGGKTPGALSFSDNRPEAAQLKQLQEASVKSPASHPLTQLKQVSGSGNFSVIQLASWIKYNTTEFDLEDGEDGKEIVGQKAEAHLESKYPLNGSAPGEGVQEGLMGGLKAKGFKRMVRGHLMNGQLGGQGIALNLFPITAKANSQHKNHVENRVKDLVTRGKDVDYTVEVVNAANTLSSPSADFDCKVTDLNKSVKDESFSELVSSAPTGNSKSSPGEGGVKNSKKGISFPTKKLKWGWGEKGKGYNGSKIDSVSFKGEKVEGSIDEYLNGRNFLKGGIDRKEYAFELLDQYSDFYDDADSYQICNMTLDELEDHIDNQEGEDLDETIKWLELAINE